MNSFKKESNKIYLILITVLLSNSVSADIKINEINYNPKGPDNNNEYIEVYDASLTNLTDYIVSDSASEDRLTLIKYFNTEISLIVEEGFNHSNLNITIYSAGATIGNNLNNDEDIVIIKDPNNTIIDAITYDSSWGADGNNKTLCKFPDSKGMWQECFATPGSKNEVTSRITYQLEINEVLPDPNGPDNASMPEGEWIELFNKGNEEIDTEGFSFKDNTGHSLTISQTTTLETTKIRPNNYLVIYANGYSGLLRNEGLEKIILYDNLEIPITEMSYSDSTQGASWSKINDIWIRTQPSPNQENIKNETKPYITLEKINLGNDNTAKFGELITIKISTNKANSTKSTIYAYLSDGKKKISQTSRIKIEKNYLDYELTIPIQIHNNCQEKLLNGRYDLILTGFSLEVTEDIELMGNLKSLCKEVKVKTKSQKIEKRAETNFDDPAPQNEITGSVIFESSNSKTKNSSIFFFGLALTLLILQISLEKWKESE